MRADGDIEAGQTFLTDKEIYDELDISSSIYSAWDNNFIYLSGTSNKSADLHLWIDGDGDGWWHGKNNLAIVFDIPSGTVTRAHAMDASDAAREFHCTLGASPLSDGRCYEMWDDHPLYPFDRIIEPGDITSASIETAPGEYRFELKIPIDSLGLDKEIGYRINFESGSSRATIFEDFEFIYFILN